MKSRFTIRKQGGLELFFSLPIPNPAPEENTTHNPLEKIKQTLSERF
ncbi:sensory histidine kinase in two-component regulatory system with OmpR domain protein [Acinetobacter baumannii 1392509]|nr:sensory histidine kinase in two-component regulatory system with OmpR domain protein [Acinetobacter baumannii 1392509]